MADGRPGAWTWHHYRGRQVLRTAAVTAWARRGRGDVNGDGLERPRSAGTVPVNLTREGRRPTYVIHSPAAAEMDLASSPPATIFGMTTRPAGTHILPVHGRGRKADLLLTRGERGRPGTASTWPARPWCFGTPRWRRRWTWRPRGGQHHYGARPRGPARPSATMGDVDVTAGWSWPAPRRPGQTATPGRRRLYVLRQNSDGGDSPPPDGSSTVQTQATPSRRVFGVTPGDGRPRRRRA